MNLRSGAAGLSVIAAAVPRRQRVLARKLFVLVYRDAARAHGVGVAAALVPFVYLFREWPPWEIRAALIRMAPLPRATVLTVVLVGYAVATAPLVRILVASHRLELLRALPLSRGFWPRVHARHLVLLGAPVWAAVAYGVAPTSTLGRIGGGLIGIGTVLTVQVFALALADRPWARRGFVVGVVLLGIGTLAYAPAVGGVLGLAGLVAAAARLRGSFPASRASRRRGRRGRSSRSVAIGRVLLRGWTRRSPAQAAWTLGMTLVIAALTAVGVGHVRAVEPGAAASMIRGAAILGGMVGAAAVLHAVRATDRDRWWWDCLPCTGRDEALGRALVAVVVTAPLALALVATALVWGRPGLALEALVAVAWTVVYVVAFVARRERDHAVLRAAAPAIIATTAVAVIGVVGVRSAWVLAPWALAEGLRARRDTARARQARRRFETYRTDDDHG